MYPKTEGRDSKFLELVRESTDPYGSRKHKKVLMCSSRKNYKEHNVVAIKMHCVHECNAGAGGSRPLPRGVCLPRIGAAGTNSDQTSVVVGLNENGRITERNKSRNMPTF
ncbi:unnamed protein product [Pieris macdunnoughi]|uniref:Uncharacterized protein n=1 Tax=Pieris macdunnoughi TaxID=345717 RepID=A0A821Y8F9_9NEOP|nr:unnamed protein product [Pieris macdunnoughi]